MPRLYDPPPNYPMINKKRRDAFAAMMISYEDGIPFIRFERTMRKLKHMGFVKPGPADEKGRPTWGPSQDGLKMWNTTLRFGT